MDRLWRKSRLALLLIAALALVASACSSDDNGNSSGNGGSSTTLLQERPSDDDEPDGTTEASYGGSITIGTEGENSTLVPSGGSIRSTTGYALYDPLVSLNDAGEFEGFLAESIDANDDLTEWTLELRSGIQFHDGTPFDAEAVEWNYENLQLREGSTTLGSLRGAGLESVEATGDLTVVFHLSGTNAAFPDVLRGSGGWMVSPTAYEADPEGFGDNPIGTGPFEFKEWRRDDRLVLTRNANYWMVDAEGNQLPYLDEVVIRPIPDEESRVQSLSAKDIDVIQTLRGLMVKRVLDLESDGGYKVSVHVGNTSHAMVLNTLEPPLDDKRVRVGLAMAIDPLAVQKVIGDDGLTLPATGFFSTDSPWYSEVVAKAYPITEEPDTEGARALIEEYENDPDRSDNKPVGSPISVEYRCMPDPALLQAGQLYQNMWGAIGVDASLAQADYAAQVSRTIGTPDTDPPFRGDFNISCWRSGAGSLDPYTAFKNEFGPVATTATNYSNFTSEEIDRWVDVLRSSTDLNERFEAVEQIGLILADEMPVIVVSPTPTAVGYRDAIHGIASWLLPSGNKGTGTEGGEMHLHQAYLDQ
ncbi:MAG: ABC transporter substrate-binding protein [Acidimicrobiia bacterium]